LAPSGGNGAGWITTLELPDPLFARLKYPAASERETIESHQLSKAADPTATKDGSSRNLQALEMFLSPLIILPFDDAAVWAYGELRAELRQDARDAT
jgi:predicted nucleic acid-binding protein